MDDTLEKYLERLGCFNIKPVKVTLGRSVYTGCRYSQERQYKSYETQFFYTIDAIYLLGDLPREDLVQYSLDGDIWYIAAYYQDGKKEFYHPFGNYILMMGLAKEIEQKPVKMLVEYL